MKLPVTRWNFKVDNADVKHMGPAAQDFYEQFGLGDDNLHIASLDSSGVALAAIQGLCRVGQEKDARIAELEARLAALESKVKQLIATRR